ncbi:acyl carrier protein [Ruminiclostridium sufflavum DSM 19573]|uniref:Acyl carrier protein n=1 Tax=Ruminiclostridium sufflavum DSM 19573 TaxID=1121337 RepID=A0A318XN14_9FIRM|nr:acyl carrier protein [Ruminiclostridium sufflavum]PYG88229.1 acyl carrier protein [Ruminiclostridium sufflavum DSM 19573]
MKKEEIEQKISELLKGRSQFNGDNIKLDCDLRDNYGIDSIALVELLIEIECEFDISIDSNLLTYEYFSTGNAICDYVFKKL